LHIGGARTALYNWLFARQNKGKFILRIEDTDTERSTDESMAAILDGMKWLGMDWDEGPGKEGPYGPYFQSQRLGIYKAHIQKLMDEGKAYPCFCTEEELKQKKETASKNKLQYRYDGTCSRLSSSEVRQALDSGKPHVIRLKIKEKKEIVIRDLIKGEIKIHTDTLDDFIILRSDGYPVYNFAVVIDDALMKINYVIRGDDHVSNTPRQILLYEALGSPVPCFAHVPMILGEDKTRLSKRHGATSVQQYREQGYLADALINYLVRLGWSYDDRQEIFSREELIEKFSLDKISGNPAVFSVKKLEWLNDVYIQKMDPDTRTQAVLPYLIKSGLVREEEVPARFNELKSIVLAFGNRIKLLADIAPQADFFFKEEHPFSPEALETFLKKIKVRPLYEKLSETLTNTGAWDKESLLAVLEGLSTRFDLKRKDYYQAIRVALTGRLFSPDLIEIMLIMGKGKTLKKIRYSLNFIIRENIG
ncbi:MAG: glutamate--tRNA ligase, partial [bacterium]|nr:glutamate--tRNA ligase [bacterium]